MVRKSVSLGLAFAALAPAFVLACSAEPEQDATAEDNLDSFDLANSWTDKANPKTPDLAGPLWWPWSMTIAGPKYELVAVRSGRPREPTALFSTDRKSVV